jgi:hypothetical protein
VELLHAKLRWLLKVGGVSDSLIQHVMERDVLLWHHSDLSTPKHTITSNRNMRIASAHTVAHHNADGKGIYVYKRSQKNLMDTSRI